jgi:hypothetical protein
MRIFEMAKTGQQSKPAMRVNRILVAGSLGEVANPFRQVQYLVIRAQRYSAYDLVDLRLSALNLYAGQETQVESFEEGDGSGLGSDEYQLQQYEQMGLMPPPEESVVALQCWWTGWWPVLHIRIEKTTSENFSIVFQLSRDILGNTETEEVSLATNNPNDPGEDEGYFEALASTLVGIWIEDWLLHLCVYLANIAAEVLCMLTQRFPALWPAAAIAIGFWVVAFILDLAHTASRICGIAENPFDRFWMIVATGLMLLLGIVWTDIIKPGLYLYVQSEINTAETSVLNERFMSMTDMSIIFLVFKLGMVLLTFLFAGLVYLFTILGWME